MSNTTTITSTLITTTDGYDFSNTTVVTWYTTTIVSVVYLILVLFPMFHLCYNVWYKQYIRKSSPTYATNAEQTAAKLKLDILVTITLFSFFSHIASHVFFRIASVTEGGLGLTQFSCEFFVVEANFWYYMGKWSMYTFFILRSWLTFKGTLHEYKKSKIIIFVIIVFLIHAALCAIFVYLWLPRTIMVVNPLDGRSCANLYSDGISLTLDLNFALLIVDTCINGILSGITLYMLIGKLFELAHVGARHRGAHRFRFNTMSVLTDIDEGSVERSGGGAGAGARGSGHIRGPSGLSVDTYGLPRMNSASHSNSSHITYETMTLTKQGSNRRYVLRKQKVSPPTTTTAATDSVSSTRNFVAQGRKSNTSNKNEQSLHSGSNSTSSIINTATNLDGDVDDANRNGNDNGNENENGNRKRKHKTSESVTSEVMSLDTKDSSPGTSDGNISDGGIDADFVTSITSVGSKSNDGYGSDNGDNGGNNTEDEIELEEVTRNNTKRNSANQATIASVSEEIQQKLNSKKIKFCIFFGITI